MYRYLLGALFFLALSTAQAQTPISAPCGVVDAIDFPIDDIIKDYDDFGLYRARFGGNHTAIDIGFDRWGDPVRAAARGRVTYSDPEGWDTEKGVIIIEHTFPDGSIYYSLYGHVEQSDTVFFPAVGRCVERGEVLAGIGWPSRGRPHLHYEIRDFLPDDGGPGYITGNPLDEGWYHPMDFTRLWQARLAPGFIRYANLGRVPTLPPVMLDTGMIALASGSLLEGLLPPNSVAWRVETDGVIIGLAGLPGGRVVAHTRNGQVVVLNGGRYAALWTVHGPDESFLVLGETLVFVTDDGGLAAYDPAGGLLWEAPGSGSARVDHFMAGADTLAFGVRDGSMTDWRLFDSSGQVVYQTLLGSAASITPLAAGGWIALDGTQLYRIAGGQRQTIAQIVPRGQRTTRITVDGEGHIYIYLGDLENTFLSVDAAGETRWRVQYPHEGSRVLAPLLLAAPRCLLYTLDADGMLNIFDSRDGALLDQRPLYAGGVQSGSPRARLLAHDRSGSLEVGAGFLTVMTLDGWQLGGPTAQDCRDNG